MFRPAVDAGQAPAGARLGTSVAPVRPNAKGPRAATCERTGPSPADASTDCKGTITVTLTAGPDQGGPVAEGACDVAGSAPGSSPASSDGSSSTGVTVLVWFLPVFLAPRRGPGTGALDLCSCCLDCGTDTEGRDLEIWL